MNWGKGIVLTCAVFICGIAFMVYTTMTKNIDLVTKNYYEEEIKYQQQIDKMNNTSVLDKKPTVETTSQEVIIIYPFKDVVGEITFYRPSDAKMDLKFPIQPDKNMKQIIGLDKLGSGLWKVKIKWNAGGVEYYNEEKIIVK